MRQPGAVAGNRSPCLRCPARRFGFVDLEAGDGLGRSAADLYDQDVLVVDPPGSVGGLDGQRASGMDNADVDALPGNDQRAAAGDASLHAYWFRCGMWRWSGWAGVAEAGLLGGRA